MTVSSNGLPQSLEPQKMLISESEVKFNALDIPRSEKDSQDDFEKIEKQIEMNEEELKNSVE